MGSWKGRVGRLDGMAERLGSGRQAGREGSVKAGPSLHPFNEDSGN